jgi:hypothetical protein
MALGSPVWMRRILPVFRIVRCGHMHSLPKRGEKPDWQDTQDYWAGKAIFWAIDLDSARFAYSETAGR